MLEELNIEKDSSSTASCLKNKCFGRVVTHLICVSQLFQKNSHGRHASWKKDYKSTYMKVTTGYKR